MHAAAKVALCIAVGVAVLLLIGGARLRPAERLALLTAPAGVGGVCGSGAYPSAWDAARAACEAGGVASTSAWAASMRRALGPSARAVEVSSTCAPNCTFSKCVHPAFVPAGRASLVVVGMGAVVAASSLNLTSDKAVVFVSSVLRRYVKRWRARLTVELVAANLVVQSPLYGANTSEVSRLCDAALELL